MASNISITTTPPEYSPVYNRVQVACKESDAATLAMPNFKFVIEVVTTDHGTQRFDVPPSLDGGSNNQGYLDFSRYIDQYIVENIVNPSLAQAVNGFYQGEQEFILEYQIDIYPGWDVAGVFTKDPNSVGAVSTAACYVWSGVFDHSAWITQLNNGSPFNTWICNITNGSNAKFLTNYPDKNVRLLDIGWTYFMTDTFSDIDQMNIRTYEPDGTFIGTFIVNNVLGGTTVKEQLMRIATAPASLNLIPGAQFASGSQPVITSSVGYYTIQLSNSAATVASELITMTIEEDCRYEVFRIHFLNRLGGFDAYNFRSRSQRTTSLTRKSYTRSKVNLNVAGTGIDYYQVDNGKTDYLVKSTDKIKLKSDYLTDEQVTWLKEMLQSTQLYLEFDEGEDRNLMPVVITNNAWREVTNSIDKLYQLDVDIELAHENISQRR